jgi:cytochrome P450
MQIVLAEAVRRFRLEALDDRIAPEPLITLRPRGGVRVRLHAR